MLKHLDRDEIRAALSDSVSGHLSHLALHEVLPSTNQVLLDEPAAIGQLKACLAERQTAGRGRQGRTWVSPAGGGVYLSVGTQYQGLPTGLSALTLAAGVVAAGALEDLGVSGLALKWPNDLVHSRRKLGGILTETTNAQGSVAVVVGIGVNYRLGEPEVPGKWDPCDLCSLIDQPPSLSAVAGRLVQNLGALLLSYTETGFAPYQDRFHAYDWMQGRSLIVEIPGADRVCGIGDGVDDDGALRLKVAGRVERVVSGEVVEGTP